jgi:hypothetical protein
MNYCQTTEEVSRILNTDSTDPDSHGEILGRWDTAGRTLKKGRSRTPCTKAKALTASASRSGPLTARVTKLISLGVELEESASK